MELFIKVINIVSALLIIVFVMLQNRGSSMSGVLGGDSETFYSRRGFDKILFASTILTAIIFVGSVLAKSIIA